VRDRPLRYGAGPKRSATLLRALIGALALALPILVAQQVPVTSVQDVGIAATPANVTGLGKSESGENGPFRWGGEQLTVQLQPLGVPMHVAVLVQGVRPDGQAPVLVGASSLGKSLGVQTVPQTQALLQYRLPSLSIFTIRPELTITSTTFQPSHDDRQLGVAFYRIEQSSGSWPSLPSLWPALAWFLSGLLLYLAIKVITGHVKLALISVLGLGILLGILNAVARSWLVFYSWYFVLPPLLALMLLPWLRDVFKLPQAAASDQDTLTPPAIPGDSERMAHCRSGHNSWFAGDAMAPLRTTRAHSIRCYIQC
jgi:hypothetical protein